MASDPTITLTRDEALVFYEWLRQLEERSTGLFRDQAEQRALWNVICLFEKELDEPFRPDYDKLVATARDRLRDPVE